jgi:hypothetical protein
LNEWVWHIGKALGLWHVHRRSFGFVVERLDFGWQNMHLAATFALRRYDVSNLLRD